MLAQHTMTRDSDDFYKPGDILDGSRWHANQNQREDFPEDGTRRDIGSDRSRRSLKIKPRKGAKAKLGKRERNSGRSMPAKAKHNNASMYDYQSLTIQVQVHYLSASMQHG